MADQRDAGKTAALLLAKETQKGRDLLRDYAQMGLVVVFTNHDHVCGIIIEPGSGWRFEKTGTITRIFDPSGNLRVESNMDFHRSDIYATVFRQN